MLISFSRFVQRFRGNLDSRRRNRRETLSAEILEPRRLLATLVNATTLSYQDIDGDNVTVKFSKPILTSGNVNSIFTFSSGVGAVNGSNVTKEALERIQLTSVGSGATATTITTTAVRSTQNGGDGYANLGELMASGVQLGAVKIDGDLGRVEAGIFSSPMGLNGLTVRSIGLYGTSSGAANLHSLVLGRLTSLTVTSSIKAARFVVSGSIGNVKIGGSLIGGSTTNSGSIFAEHAAGAVVAINGGIIGGTGIGSGRLQLGGAKSVTVGGSMKGGTGEISGTILGISLGAVTVKGSVEGGSGKQSGRVASFGGPLASVTINGSLVGGIGEDSGTVSSSIDLGQTKISGNVIGGSGIRSGSIEATVKIASVSINGSVVGDSGFESGTIRADSIGHVTINGDLTGGMGQFSGRIFTMKEITAVTINGSVIGGSGFESGRIRVLTNLGTVKIKGSVVGGDGESSGCIYGFSTIGNVSIGGSLVGGGGNKSGWIDSNGDVGTVTIGVDLIGAGTNTATINAVNGLGNVTIGGSIIGAPIGATSGQILSGMNAGMIKVGGNLIGVGINSAVIRVKGNIVGVTVGGSIRGGGDDSGQIMAEGDITTVTIGGDIVGGNAIGAMDLERSGFVSADRINTLTLGGSLIAGVDGTIGTYQNNGAIRVAEDLGTMLIKGNVRGNSTNRAVISAHGKAGNPAGAADVAIANLTINGDVEYALIQAGVEIDGNPTNADAQITKLTVVGDWIASSVAAGTTAGPDAKFGNNDDLKMSGAAVKDDAASKSKIGSITIGGQVQGTLTNGDHFGFTSQEIKSFKVGDTTFALAAGSGTDAFFIGITNDVQLLEIV